MARITVREKVRIDRLVNELIEESKRIFNSRTSLSQEIIDSLCEGIRRALLRVPVEHLPSIEIWGLYFREDVLRTEKFLRFDRKMSRNADYVVLAVRDVVKHWQIQAKAVCRQPELLVHPYRERVIRAGLPPVRQTSLFVSSEV